MRAQSVRCATQCISRVCKGRVFFERRKWAAGENVGERKLLPQNASLHSAFRTSIPQDCDGLLTGQFTRNQDWNSMWFARNFKPRVVRGAVLQRGCLLGFQSKW